MLCMRRHRISTITQYPGRIENHLVAYIIAAYPGHHFLEFGDAERKLFHSAVRLVRAFDTIMDSFKSSDMRFKRVPVALTREYPEVLVNYMTHYREWNDVQSMQHAWKGAMCYISDLMSMDMRNQSVMEDLITVRRRIASGLGAAELARVDAGLFPDDCWSLLHRMHHFTAGLISKPQIAHELCMNPMPVLSPEGYWNTGENQEHRLPRRRKLLWDLVHAEMFHQPRRFDHLLRAVAELQGGISELGGHVLIDHRAIRNHLEASDGKLTIAEMQVTAKPILSFLSAHMKHINSGWDYVVDRLIERNYDAWIVLPNFVNFCLKRLEIIFADRFNLSLRALAPSIVPLAPEYLRQCLADDTLTRGWVQSVAVKNMTLERLHAVGISRLIFSVNDPIPETLQLDHWRIEDARITFAGGIFNQLELQAVLETMLCGVGSCAIMGRWRSNLGTLHRIARVSILVHGERYISMLRSTEQK